MSTHSKSNKDSFKIKWNEIALFHSDVSQEIKQKNGIERTKAFFGERAKIVISNNRHYS